MKLLHVFSDATGHSQLGEIELAQATGGGAGPRSAIQPMNYWQMAVSDPGDLIDFQPTDMNRLMAVLSGQVDVTVSNGDVVSLVRGDMLYQSDLMGQGHKMRFVGAEPCTMLNMAMPGALK